jgi:methionine-S-sulfoxide reductase
MNKSFATFAGGCFWGMEDLFRKLPGVLNTQVGYCGGPAEQASYKNVKTGKTGHAEALHLEFNPSVTSFEALLRFFFKIHDPTTQDRQGNDIGSQYRSAVFFHNQEQLDIAKKMIQHIENRKIFKAPIVTQLLPFEGWFDAEDEHQDYLVNNPNGYTCHYIRNFDI